MLTTGSYMYESWKRLLKMNTKEEVGERQWKRKKRKKKKKTQKQTKPNQTNIERIHSEHNNSICWRFAICIHSLGFGHKIGFHLWCAFIVQCPAFRYEKRDALMNSLRGISKEVNTKNDSLFIFFSLPKSRECPNAHWTEHTLLFARYMP